MKNRQEINQKIVYELSKLVNKYPDLRFGQILSNFGFIEQTNHFEDDYHDYDYWKDEFYIEPEEILERIQKAIK